MRIAQFKNIKNTTTRVECFIIFFAACTIYLLNNGAISAGDTIPNTILAFNLLENHTLHLDVFRGSYLSHLGGGYFFVEAKNGHLTSVYPIGTAIVTFPLYIAFYFILKIIHVFSTTPLDMTSSSFEGTRILFEKLSATITASTSVFLFYLTSRLKFKRSKALITTFIFGFATNTWMTSSQGLWQHGISNLVLVSAIFFFLKANRSLLSERKPWLVLAGVACGLLPGIRPTSLVFSVALLSYAIFIHRTQYRFFLVGLLSMLPTLMWNLYYFGNFTGGYSSVASSVYAFNFGQFIESSLGTFISPSRGLLVYSPVVLFALPGAFRTVRSWREKDEKLFLLLSVASLLLILNYSFYKIWWAGHSYGPRFMTDILPIACYFLNYSGVGIIDFLNKDIKRGVKITLRSIFSAVFIITLFYSTYVQFVGSFGANPGVLWNGIPLSVDQYQYRLWQSKDTQIERNSNALFHKIFPPRLDKPSYLHNLRGHIQAITGLNGEFIPSTFIAQPGSQKTFRMELENIGSSRWFGYPAALNKGEVRVRARFFDNQGKVALETHLFVSGTPSQHQKTEAIGAIDFPKRTGKYTLAFDLIAEGIGEFPDKSNVLFYTVEVLQKFFSQEIKVLSAFNDAKADSMIKVSLDIKNTSNFSWTNQTHDQPVNLSYHWLDSDGKMFVFDGLRTPLPFTLSPGKSAVLNAVIKTPNQKGKYSLILTMVQEQVAWFADQNAQPTSVDVEIKS